MIFMDEIKKVKKEEKKPVKDGERQAIKNWNKNDRPREKLLENKPQSLSESELLAILLRTGATKKSALDLSRTLLDIYRSLQELGKCSARELMKIEGIGEAKA